MAAMSQEFLNTISFRHVAAATAPDLVRPTCDSVIAEWILSPVVRKIALYHESPIISAIMITKQFHVRNSPLDIQGSLQLGKEVTARTRNCLPIASTT